MRIKRDIPIRPYRVSRPGGLFETMITQDEIKKMLDDHKLWYESKGKDGKSADFRKAYLKCANFSNAKLRVADFKNADLTGADFEGADLTGADLEGADLRGANLSFANLRGADLKRAILCDCNMDGAKISYRCKIIRVRFEEVGGES